MSPFGANYYWVPGSRRDDVKVLQYADRLKIFLRHDLPGRVSVAARRRAGTTLQSSRPTETTPSAEEPPPRCQARRTTAPRAWETEVAAYLDYALTAPGVQRHRFTRELFALSRKVTRSVFVKTVQRALRYRIVDLATVRRIAWLCISQAEDVLPEADVDEDFQQRPAYQEGCLTDQPDLSVYDQLCEEDEKEEEQKMTTNPGKPHKGMDEELDRAC